MKQVNDTQMSEVFPVTIHTPHHGHSKVTAIVIELTFLSFDVNQPTQS